MFSTLGRSIFHDRAETLEIPRFRSCLRVSVDKASTLTLPTTGRASARLVSVASCFTRLDDRVPASEQAGPELYSSNDFDRGHLVRRRDPGWGDEAVARAATEATFRYPNAAPQASVFNQSKDLWLGLEDHVLGYAETTDQRVSVFTAPVLAAADPLYRGIQIPLRFWKVAAWASPVGLRSAGFILDQTDLVRLSDDAGAVPPLGAFKTFQVPVGDVELISGVSLGELVATDTISQGVRAVSWRELATTDDVVL